MKEYTCLVFLTDLFDVDMNVIERSKSTSNFNILRVAMDTLIKDNNIIVYLPGVKDEYIIDSWRYVFMKNKLKYTKLVGDNEEFPAYLQKKSYMLRVNSDTEDKSLSNIEFIPLIPDEQ